MLVKVGGALKLTLGFTGEWMDSLRDTSWGVGGAAGCTMLALRRWEILQPNQNWQSWRR